MKVAIVQEWLVTLGGSELVLRELLRLFPNADVFTLLDKMPATDRAFVGLEKTRTSFLDRVPGIERHYRALLPLMPAAIRSLDVSGYDVVISNSHAVAKGIRTHRGQVHVCYCLSPMRYAWDLRDQYLRQTGLDRGIKGMVARRILDGLREWDRANTAGVDQFATLSHYIAERIRRAYGRESTVIYPPVDTEFFTPGVPETSDDGYYVTASRLVPYKRLDLIASAFRLLDGRKLVLIGDGPERERVRAASGSNVTMVGHVDRDTLRSIVRGARAFLFAAEEDFGIAPVEAQACGTPVIAFARGGATETVLGANSECPTGTFFTEQTEASIADAVHRFEHLDPAISRAHCRANALRFSEARFREEFLRFVQGAVEANHVATSAAD